MTVSLSYGARKALEILNNIPDLTHEQREKCEVAIYVGDQTARVTAEIGGYSLGPRLYATQGLFYITSLALFIIGCMGVAGAFPGGPTIGWVAVGLAGGGFVATLAAGNLKKRKVELIGLGFLTAILIAVGALGGTGILSVTQVGYGVLFTPLAFLPIACASAKLKNKQIAEEAKKPENQKALEEAMVRGIRNYCIAHNILGTEQETIVQSCIAKYRATQLDHKDKDAERADSGSYKTDADQGADA